MEPSPNARTVQSYELIADDYARDTAGPGRVLSGGLDQLVARMPGARVLEIGSGPGWDADILEDAGLTVLRTDITQAFIDGQRSRGKAVERLDAITDDLGGPFDAVVTLHVLQHMESDDLDTVLTKVAGALRPGGRFLVSIPLGADAGFEIGESGRAYYRALRTETDFVAALARAGLTVEWRERSVDPERSADEEETGWLCLLARVT